MYVIFVQTETNMAAALATISNIHINEKRKMHTVVDTKEKRRRSGKKTQNIYEKTRV